MDGKKLSQYTYLSRQLQELEKNLEVTKRELETLSSHCNKNIVGQLGKINASWFMASNRWLLHEFLQDSDTQ